MTEPVYYMGIKIEFDPPRPELTPQQYQDACAYIALRLKELRESRDAAGDAQR